MQKKSKNHPSHKRCQARSSPGHLAPSAATFAVGCAVSSLAWLQSDAGAARRMGVRWVDGSAAIELRDPSRFVSAAERCVTP